MMIGTRPMRNAGVIVATTKMVLNTLAIVAR